MNNNCEGDCLFVLFGAGGDLSWRLVVPALFQLYCDQRLPEHFELLGIDRQPWDDAALRERLHDGVQRNAETGPPEPDRWEAFAQNIRYMRGELGDPATYRHITETVGDAEQRWQGPAERVFYLAIPPTLFGDVARGLGEAGLAEPRHCTRVVVEKPLGHDLESFRAINRALVAHFQETQIYRIDHFLGKETVQNILALRFANPIFEPIWNRRYIDHVAITVAETLGVEHRAAYYERAGALRDMVQNHLMQLLCLIAMEPPVAFDAEDLRNKKMDVMHALRPIAADAVHEFAARGQYGAGWIRGTRVPGYREEPDVGTRSNVETYAALKLHVDNWRWQDVPFYLRTGKRMSAAVSEVSIRFQQVPHRAFPASASSGSQPARLVLQISPDEGIVLKFYAKQPGQPLRLRLVDMHFGYGESFEARVPSAYETLIRELIAGNSSLFMRDDQVEAAWRLLTPVLESWENNAAPDFPNYQSGTWGPEAAEVLVARDGRSWLTPTPPRERPA